MVANCYHTQLNISQYSVTTAIHMQNMFSAGLNPNSDKACTELYLKNYINDSVVCDFVSKDSDYVTSSSYCVFYLSYSIQTSNNSFSLWIMNINPSVWHEEQRGSDPEHYKRPGTAPSVREADSGAERDLGAETPENGKDKAWEVRTRDGSLMRLMRDRIFLSFLIILYSVLYCIIVEICDIALFAFWKRIKLPSLVTTAACQESCIAVD